MTTDRVKQVKEANDIVDVVGGFVALRPAGMTYKGLCPFHDDHRPSFDVDPRRQRYRCWSCGKYGDVIQFVQEHERVGFAEAVEFLARRANITLEDFVPSARQTARAPLFEVVRWAADLYQRCFIESEEALSARRYLGERRLLGPTLRKFGVGYAPANGHWLVDQAIEAGVPLELLEKVGLIAPRTHSSGFYDRFRDRVLFPIRDPLGRPVGFGGRVLPDSPLASRGPKYYNSSDTPLFSKSDSLFGLDVARTIASREGTVAIVEGYTDVLMAHQCGVANVVATMGTALTSRHVQGLLRCGIGRVLLVFDADAGGETGVDRALEIFASQEVHLTIATLPVGLDPYDLLLREGGAEQFRQILAQAVDALDFKLQHLLASEEANSLEGRRRAVDAILNLVALAPERTGQAGAVKRELIVNRLSQRLGLKEETIWARLDELRVQRRKFEERERMVRSGSESAPEAEEDATTSRSAAAPPEERQLLELLLAEPGLLVRAREEVLPERLRHPGLRHVLETLYALQAEGLPATLDQVRSRITNPRLAAHILRLHDVGQMHPDRSRWFEQLMEVFRGRRVRAENQEIQHQLHAASDHSAALELLRQIQNQQGL